MNRYDVEDKQRAAQLLPDWLAEYVLGEGTSLTDSDANSLSGLYEVEPLGMMVIHESLGRRPYLRFQTLTINSGQRSRRFTDRDEFEALLTKENSRGDYIYLLNVSELW